MSTTDASYTSSTACTVNMEASLTDTWAPPSDPVPQLTAGLIDCAVGYADELRLTPRTDLARSLLMQFLHGDTQWAATLQMGVGSLRQDGTHGRQLQYVTVRRTTAPLLASGNDPYYTGQTISPEEHAACNALVDRMRRAAARKRRK